MKILRPATLAFMNVLQNTPKMYALHHNFFKIGYKTKSCNVNIDGDDWADECCPLRFRFEIKRLEDGRHEIRLRFSPKSGRKVEKEPHMRINNSWINPSESWVLKNGDFVSCSCQSSLTWSNGKNLNQGGCVMFQYFAARPMTNPSSVESTKPTSLEDLPLEIQLQIFALLDPTTVATRLAATSTALFYTVKTKVPFHHLTYQAEPPCLLRLWIPVTVPSAPKSLDFYIPSFALRHDVDLYFRVFNAFVANSLVCGNQLEAIHWRGGQMGYRGISSDEYDTLSLLTEDMSRILTANQNLKSLTIEGDADQAEIIGMLGEEVRLKNLQELAIYTSVREGQDVNMWWTLEKTTPNLKKLRIDAGEVTWEAVTSDRLENLQLLEITCRLASPTQGLDRLVQVFPSRLTSLIIDLTTQEDFLMLSTALACTTQLKHLKIDIRRVPPTVNPKTLKEDWTQVFSRFPTSLIVLSIHVQHMPFQPLVDILLQRVLNLRIFVLDVDLGVPGASRRTAATIPRYFVQACPHLDILSIQLWELEGSKFDSLSTNLRCRDCHGDCYSLGRSYFNFVDDLEQIDSGFDTGSHSDGELDEGVQNYFNRERYLVARLLKDLPTRLQKTPCFVQRELKRFFQ